MLMSIGCWLLAFGLGLLVFDICFWLLAYGFRFSASGFRFPASGVWFPLSGFRFSVFGFWFSTFGFQFFQLVSFCRHPASNFRFWFWLFGSLVLCLVCCLLFCTIFLQNNKQHTRHNNITAIEMKNILQNNTNTTNTKHKNIHTPMTHSLILKIQITTRNQSTLHHHIIDIILKPMTMTEIITLIVTETKDKKAITTIEIQENKNSNIILKLDTSTVEITLTVTMTLTFHPYLGNNPVILQIYTDVLKKYKKDYLSN